MAETLCEELVEEVLVRLPLDDPESLVRADLVCRKWALAVSGAGFRSQFREFHHRGPPMLGCITAVDRSRYVDPEEGADGEDSDGEDGDGEDFEDSEVISRFHSTSTFRPLLRASRLGWHRHAVDSSHGRVLLYPMRQRGAFENLPRLWVWCPITGEELQLPLVRRCPYPERWSAALVCAADAEAGGGACDHLDGCHRRPFLVVLVGTDQDGTFSCVYSSANGAWGDPTSAQIPRSRDWLETVPPARVGNALYFLYRGSARILRYDVAARGFSVIDRPPQCSVDFQGSAVLMSMEDGTLGFAAVHEYILRLWAREVGADGKAAWVRRQSH